MSEMQIVPARRGQGKAVFNRQNQGQAKAPANKQMVQKKPAPKPQRATPTVQRKKAPVGHFNLLNPMVPQLMPVLASDGKAFPLTGLASGDFTVGPDEKAILIVTNTGSSSNVGYFRKVNATTGAFIPGEGFDLNIPTLVTPDTGGGASAIRAMKLSCSVVNVTNALKRGGRVTYLNSSQRLPPFLTEDDPFSAIFQGVRDSPHRRRITGDDLVTPKQLIGYPCDNSAYTTFTPHHGQTDATTFLGHCLTASSAVPAAARPMSVIVWMFEPPADVNDYSITVRASYYTRWPLTSVPGQAMRDIPHAPPALINSHRDHAENTANDLVHVAEGGAAATLLPKAIGAARSLAQSAIAHFGEMGAVEAAEDLAIAPLLL